MGGIKKDITYYTIVGLSELVPKKAQFGVRRVQGCSRSGKTLYKLERMQGRIPRAQPRTQEEGARPGHYERRRPC